MTRATPQVLVIGLDGATWRVLDPWSHAGRLPHLTALMERGARGILQSTVPALTLPAWSSCMTGIGRDSASRRSISKHSGAATSSSRIAPNEGAIWVTVSTKTCTSRVGIRMGMPDRPASRSKMSIPALLLSDRSWWSIWPSSSSAR